MTVQCYLFPWGILVFCQISKTNETGHHKKTKLTETTIISDECSTGDQKIILDHRSSRVIFFRTFWNF